MDYLTVVTVAGKSFFLAGGDRQRLKVVRAEKIVSRTGVETTCGPHKRQRLYLTLAGSAPK